MDLSIKTISPGMHFDRGVNAHAHGRGINDHYMNPGALAIKEWQRGWRFAVHQAGLAMQAHQVEVSPP
jgi:hypothetical protein